MKIIIYLHENNSQKSICHLKKESAEQTFPTNLQ